MFSPTPEPRRATLLLIDDTPTNIDVLVGLLRDSYDLKVATRGATALRICENHQAVDMVLLDVMMPEMDGYEVCRRLRAAPATQDLPIIFLTAKTDLDDIVKGFEIGANDYLTKPFRPAELRARVRTHLQLRSQKQELDNKNAELHALVHLLCHDIANKFAVLRLVMELIDACPETDARTFLPRIKLAVDCGVGLTDVVRRFEAADAKGFALQPVDLRAAVEDVAALLRDRLKAKEQRLEIDLVDCNVLAEPWSLRNSVLENLVGNSIKFTARGGTIRIQTEVFEKEVVVTLQDQGVGIPAAMLPILWNVTKSSSREGTEGERGTGFGMPLVKRCVTLYGGSVEVESRSQEDYPLDHGSTFRLRFARA